MRSLLGGLLLLALASSALAQVRGEVESVGFGSEGFYRPECWTPMVVRLDSQIDDTAEYRIEVHQRDLDFDHVIYVKDGITLNGHATQRWELCFLPEPNNGGLPDLNIPELQSRLRVYLTSKDGSKQLLQLPITSPVNTLEPIGGGFTHPKGQKLILYVADGSDKPAVSEYMETIGQVETPVFVPRNPREMPQSILAYQAVDAVLWLHGDARTLSEQGSTQLTALQQWVRQGGMLVICQPASDGERQLIAPFADMLPIKWQENGEWKVSIQNKSDPAPLPELASRPRSGSTRPEWRQLKGPFAFARAVAKPNAVVDEATIDWSGDGKDQTPYIVRIPYGLGSVTWIAQDLGDRAIATKTTGWPYLWDHVFGWNNDTYVKSDAGEREQGLFTESLAGAGPTDLGTSQSQGTEFANKGAGLITLAVFFFIAYWLVAGPGTYLFLAGKKRKQHSWTAFGFTALAATFLTILVVRLVLRGDPEIHHASDVRIASQQPQPAIVYSRLGLYIPRDGQQQVALQNTSSDFVSYVTPLPMHPALVPDNEFPANLDYRVPVRQSGAPDVPAIDVPFRSTLKKLQAKWCGDLDLKVRANSVKVHIDDSNHKIEGYLDNLSGITFKNVYIAFSYNNDDYALYIPTWDSKPPANRLDLADRFAKAALVPPFGISNPGTVVPGYDKDCQGDFNNRWQYYWHNALRGNERWDDLTSRVPVAFPVLSFFDRIKPPVNEKSTGSEAFTLLRRGMRKLNMSQALEAGELVVLAEAPNRPLPYPLQVNGSQIDGDGTVFYQFAFPIERPAPPPPPATAPATEPAAIQSPTGK